MSPVSLEVPEHQGVRDVGGPTDRPRAELDCGALGNKMASLLPRRERVAANLGERRIVVAVWEPLTNCRREEPRSASRQALSS